MGNSREASPDWLRSFQAPTQSITTLSSDSEPSSDKIPARDDSDTKHRTSNLLEDDGEEDEKICDIAMTSNTKKSPNKKTTKKRVKVGDETPAKRKKAEKLEKRGSEDENVKMEEISDKSTEIPATAPNHSVCELSSVSESNLDATIREKKEKHDDEESAPSSAVKGKSPKKRMKREDVQPTENKKTNELSSDSESSLDATIREKKEKHNDEESTPHSAVKGKSPKKRMKQEDIQPTEKKRTYEPLKI